MGFLDGKSTYQPYFRLLVGYDPGGEGLVNPVNVGDILTKSIKNITVTHEVGKPTTMEIQFEYGVTSELDNFLDGQPSPYLFFDAKNLGMRLEAGYRGLDPLDRIIEVAQIDPSTWKPVEGPYSRGFVSQQAVLFTGRPGRPRVTGDNAGMVTITVKGHSSPSMRDFPGGGFDLIKTTDTRGKPVRSSSIRPTEDNPGENTGFTPGSTVASTIRDACEEVFNSSSDINRGVEYDFGLLQAWPGVSPNDQGWFKPYFIPRVESPYEYLRRLCDYYGVQFLEIPNEETNSVKLIFYPAGNSADYYRAVSLKKGERGVLTPSQTQALVLLYGYGVTSFSYDLQPVTVQGNKVTSITESGDSFEIEIDDEAVKEAVRVQFASLEGGPSLSNAADVGKHFINLSRSNPLEFIKMFTTITGNPGSRPDFVKPAGVGSGGHRLELNLKWAIPGLLPMTQAYFGQPKNTGAQNNVVLPKSTQQVYRIQKVVDKFDAKNEIYTQSLSLVR